jgi:hypothetical protein
VKITVFEVTGVELFEVSVTAGMQDGLAKALGSIHGFIAERGGQEYEPAQPIWQLRRDLHHLRNMRKFQMPGRLELARQVFTGEWVWTKENLVHVPSRLMLPVAHILEHDWIADLRAKHEWFDIYGELAVRTVQKWTKLQKDDLWSDIL